MPTLEEVYRKFGETAEAAQLLETELGNVLFLHGAFDEDLLTVKNPNRAAAIMSEIDASTLGRLLARLKSKMHVPSDLESLLSEALKQRNLLSHSFYRQHNFRRNSDEGRSTMIDDLDSMHESIIQAYKAVLRLSGTDLDSMTSASMPTRHLPI